MGGVTLTKKSGTPSLAMATTPKPDWSLIYFGVRYRRWLRMQQPLPEVKAAVRLWAREVARHGPKGTATTSTDEDFVDWVDEALDVMVAFTRVDDEELVLVRSIY